MSEDRRSFRASALLSCRRALLGEVAPELRGIAVSTVYPTFRARFIYDKRTGIREEMITEDVETEVMADFLPPVDVNFATVAIPLGQECRLLVGEEWLFLRKDDEGIGRVTGPRGLDHSPAIDRLTSVEEGAWLTVPEGRDGAIEAGGAAAYRLEETGVVDSDFSRFRISSILHLQRALLGEVVSELRAIAMSPIRPLLQARFIYEEAGFREVVITANVEAKVAAGFLPPVEVSFIPVALPVSEPLRLLPGEEWFFKRREVGPVWDPVNQMRA